MSSDKRPPHPAQGLADQVTKIGETAGLCGRCGMSALKHKAARCPDNGGVFKPQLSMKAAADAAETAANLLEQGPSMLLGHLMGKAREWAGGQIFGETPPPPPNSNRTDLVKPGPIEPEYTPPKRKG